MLRSLVGSEMCIRDRLKETHDYQLDGYRRLYLTFLQPREKMIPQYKQIGDDTNRRTLYYYVTFGCMAVFGTETIQRQLNITEDFEGIYLYFFEDLVIR